MKKAMKKLACLALAFVMALSIIVVASPSDASAASVKKVTATKSYKKAPALKTGNNKVTTRNSGYLGYYVKYKAPKKGTYVFTFTDIQSTNTNKEVGYGNIYFYKLNGKSLGFKTVKTNGGERTDCLFMCTKYCWNNFDKATYKGSAHNYAYKRTATVSLKKGETVYITSYFAGEKTKHNFMVNVKKK